MDGSGQISRQQFIDAMRDEFERTMGRVADAVNAAPDGAWIDASEPIEKHYNMVRRRAERGQYLHHPYLGEVGQ